MSLQAYISITHVANTGCNSRRTLHEQLPLFTSSASIASSCFVTLKSQSLHGDLDQSIPRLLLHTCDFVSTPSPLPRLLHPRSSPSVSSHDP